MTDMDNNNSSHDKYAIDHTRKDLFGNLPPARDDYLGLIGADGNKISMDELDRELNFYFSELVPKPMHVLLVPPGNNTGTSMSGLICARIYGILSDMCRVDVMPAVEDGSPMSPEECDEAFEGIIPYKCLFGHDCINDVRHVGDVPADIVNEATEGIYNEPVHVSINRRILNPAYDFIIVIGPVAPDDVIGMSAHNRNLFFGCGGFEIIGAARYISSLYGTSRVIGFVDNPVKKIFDYAEKHFLPHVSVLYVNTVIRTVCKDSRIFGGGSTVSETEPALMGLYVGRGTSPFKKACERSEGFNFTILKQRLKKVVLYLDENMYRSVTRGNEALVRVLSAICDGGELLVLAPGVSCFAEDQYKDSLIRKYGYIDRDKIISQTKENEELHNNLSVSANIIQFAAAKRVDVTYAAGGLSSADAKSVGLRFRDYADAIKEYDPAKLYSGFNTLGNGEEIYFIPIPTFGLWKCE